MEHEELTETLIRRARTGDDAALNELLVVFWPEMQRLAASMLDAALRQRVDESDVAHNVSVIAWQRFRPMFFGSTAHELFLWLRQITRHALQNLYRYHYRKKRNLNRELPLPSDRSSADSVGELCSDWTTPRTKAVRREEAEWLQKALESLPPSERTAIQLRLQQELTLDEIARRMDRSPAAVAGLLKRARRRLNNLRQPACNEVGHGGE